MNTAFAPTRRAFAYERLGSITTVAAVSLSAASYTATSTSAGNARSAVITVETANIRFRIDGGVPTTGTSGNGHLAAPGDVINLEGLESIKNFQAIGEVGTGAIHVTYLR